MSEYRIRITHVTGRDATLLPGGQGERDLVDAVTAKAVAKGVGFLKTETQVKAAITDAFRDVLRDLKTEVQPQMSSFFGPVDTYPHAWNVNTLQREPMTQPGGSTGGGGDASAANQATEIAALGASTDAEATGNGSIIAVLKRIRTLLGGTLAVSGPLTDTQLRAAVLPVVTARPSAAARTSVTAAAADTAILAANTARFGATVWNDADKTLYLALGSAAASTSSFTAQLAPNGYYETPFNYTGAVRGIWAAAPTGSARVTETT